MDHLAFVKSMHINLLTVRMWQFDGQGLVSRNVAINFEAY